MKVKFSIIVTLIFSTVLCLIPNEKAEAAMGKWQNVEKGCKVRIWTDATTYTKRATSIDWYAETNGRCGTLKYDARIFIRGERYVWYHNLSGSFAKRTPTKKFLLSKVRRWIESGEDVVVELGVHNRAKGISGVLDSNRMIVY
ncbi:cell wall-binding protein [Bacillus sp. CLL-7-23]|uniref:Cell wall-binding protein n=1 Tax=Bacillus changyiensis TaxID=3004103 RepID=A0ABT4X1V4_9BACI|nr:cell wall-binding protein [Bacillus changyiensis]MDA7026251.1 cell wall-binding protein [Bacillus changyiensis]